MLGNPILETDTPDVVRRLGGIDSDVIYFLPWRTPYIVGRVCGFLPLPFAACYETPACAVCPDPVRSVVTFRRIISDALGVIEQRRGLDPPLMIGFSLGTVAATYVANVFGAPLLSICGAARGEGMIWDSPSAVAIKMAAEQRGYQHTHFYSALGPLNPAENLSNLDQRSLFVIAEHDRIIPHAQRATWNAILASRSPRARVMRMPCGHVAAIISSGALQTAWRRSQAAGASKR